MKSSTAAAESVFLFRFAIFVLTLLYVACASISGMFASSGVGDDSIALEISPGSVRRVIVPSGRRTLEGLAISRVQGTEACWAMEQEEYG